MWLKKITAKDAVVVKSRGKVEKAEDIKDDESNPQDLMIYGCLEWDRNKDIAVSVDQKVRIQVSNGKFGDYQYKGYNAFRINNPMTDKAHIFVRKWRFVSLTQSDDYTPTDDQLKAVIKQHDGMRIGLHSYLKVEEFKDNARLIDYGNEMQNEYDSIQESKERETYLQGFVDGIRAMRRRRSSYYQWTEL